jgi:hypothetical protein
VPVSNKRNICRQTQRNWNTIRVNFFALTTANTLHGRIGIDSDSALRLSVLDYGQISAKVQYTNKKRLLFDDGKQLHTIPTKRHIWK